MRINGSRIVKERSSPLALLTVVENDRVPFRHAPGLSLTAQSEPPAQVGIFMDNDAMSVITRFPGDRSRLAFLDKLASALPYHLGLGRERLRLGNCRCPCHSAGHPFRFYRGCIDGPCALCAGSCFLSVWHPTGKKST